LLCSLAFCLCSSSPFHELVLSLSLYMALPIADQKYSSIRLADADLEDDSDTTLGSIHFTERRTKRRRRQCRKPELQSVFTWLRWTIVVLLQSAIIFLLVRNNQTTDRKTTGWSQADTETGGDINGLYVPSMDNLHPLEAFG